jgi:hypothetical protein
MKSQLYTLLLAIGLVGCFAGYSYALFDWVRDYHTGVYQRERLEAFYETAGLLCYTLLGMRFSHQRMKGG